MFFYHKISLAPFQFGMTCNTEVTRTVHVPIYFTFQIPHFLRFNFNARNSLSVTSLFVGASRLWLSLRLHRLILNDSRRLVFVIRCGSNNVTILWKATQQYLTWDGARDHKQGGHMRRSEGTLDFYRSLNCCSVLKIWKWFSLPLWTRVSCIAQFNDLKTNFSSWHFLMQTSMYRVDFPPARLLVLEYMTIWSIPCQVDDHRLTENRNP